MAKKSSWLLAGGILALAALAAYHNSFAGPFIFDDVWAIRENPTIRNLSQALSPPHQGRLLTVSGRPLLNLSLAVNYSLGGAAVWGYHALNLAIHFLAGLTLLGIVRRTLLQPALRARFGAASLPLAATVALLWTLHPLQTESVTYVVQRAESLMGLFYLLTLYCFIRGAESPAPGRLVTGQFAFSGVGGALVAPRCEASSQPTNWSNYTTAGLWQGLSVAACLAGMATKEVMVSAPLMVLLYDRTFVAGTFQGAWRRHRRLYAGLAGTWLLLGWLVAGTGGNRGGSIGFDVGISWWTYFATQFRALTCYLWLSLWPHPLIFEYGTEWIRRASEILPYALLMVSLVAATVIGLWRRTVPGFIGAWFFAILAPTSLVPGTVQIIVEHRMYLPLAAVLALAVPGIYTMAGRRSLVVFLGLAAGLGWVTSQRNNDYRSDVAIWSDSVAKRPGNVWAHGNLGHALFQAGRVPEAIGHYEEALRLKPDYVETQSNLGLALFQTGRIAEAMRHYEEALRLSPDFAEAHYNLGNALLQTGRLPEALRHYGEALRLKPDSAEIQNNLGYALLQAGRVPEAIRHCEEALRLNPDSASAHNNLGYALLQTGRLPEAIRHYEEALRLKPDSADTHDSLGYALLKAGRLPEAIRHCEESLRLRPDSADTHNNLGTLLLQAGRVAEAKEQYAQALRIDPTHAAARASLARLQALQPTPGPGK